MMGVMAFSAEFVRQHDRGNNLIAAGWRSALHCLALAPPLLLMFAWRSGQAAGPTGDWFNWRTQFFWILWALRDRWSFFAVASLGPLLPPLLPPLSCPPLPLPP